MLLRFVDVLGRMLGPAPWLMGLTLASGGVAATGSLPVTPEFSVLEVGATATLGTGAEKGASWTSLGDAAEVVGGTVRGRRPGVARIVARAGARSDTVQVAVLGARSLLATAFPDERYRLEQRPGGAVRVPVTLDLTRAAGAGSLGAAEFDLRFDPAVLQLDSVTYGVRGAADSHQVARGHLRFAFAGTAPQPAPQLTLAVLWFRVAAGAEGGRESALDVTFTDRPSDTLSRPYEAPVAVGGRVRVLRR